MNCKYKVIQMKKEYEYIFEVLDIESNQIIEITEKTIHNRVSKDDKLIYMAVLEYLYNKDTQYAKTKQNNNISKMIQKC